MASIGLRKGKKEKVNGIGMGAEVRQLFWAKKWPYLYNLLRNQVATCKVYICLASDIPISNCNGGNGPG